MANKKYKPGEIVAKLRQVNVSVSADRRIHVRAVILLKRVDERFLRLAVRSSVWQRPEALNI